jgi:pSer/pThr/pTyr-binding forkhead associated (FHA) protein
MKRAPVITVQLVHIQGPLKGNIQEFTKDIVALGRHPGCDLCFPKDLTTISRKHAEIIREGNRFKLIDHSTNGTIVNGKKVKEAFLKDGDVLEIGEGGPKVSFLTRMEDDQATIQDMAAPSREPHETPAKRSEEKAEDRKPIEILSERPAEPLVETVAAPLVIQYGPTIRSFKQLPVTIGSHPNCGFVIDRPSIISHHMQVFFFGDGYWVKDLTGQKMVTVNGKVIEFQAPLSISDHISLGPRGPSFTFVGMGRLAEAVDPENKPSAQAEKTEEIPHSLPSSEPKSDGDGLFSKLKKLL